MAAWRNQESLTPDAAESGWNNGDDHLPSNRLSEWPCCFSPSVIDASRPITGRFHGAIEAVKTDFGNFYLDRENLTRLGIGVAGAAVFANTGMDRYIRNKYQNDLRSHGTDEATKIFNISGTALALVTVPVYIGTYGAGLWLHNPTMEEWAQKSFRATVVGGPALVFLAAATGGDRPTEGDSHWKPFQNFHGVSGHAYFGAVPFITAAKMSENPYQKAIFYGLSTFTGLSRINDDKHYFSQVGPGVVPRVFELRRRREGKRSAGRTRACPTRARPERDRDYGAEEVLTA